MTTARKSKNRNWPEENVVADRRKADLHQWLAKESIRRRDEVRTGKVKPVPAAEVYRRIERLLTK